MPLAIAVLVVAVETVLVVVQEVAKVIAQVLVSVMHAKERYGVVCIYIYTTLYF